MSRRIRYTRSSQGFVDHQRILRPGMIEQFEREIEDAMVPANVHYLDDFEIWNVATNLIKNWDRQHEESISHGYP